MLKLRGDLKWAGSPGQDGSRHFLITILLGACPDPKMPLIISLTANNPPARLFNEFRRDELTIRTTVKCFD